MSKAVTSNVQDFMTKFLYSQVFTFNTVSDLLQIVNDIHMVMVNEHVNEKTDLETVITKALRNTTSGKSTDIFMSLRAPRSTTPLPPATFIWKQWLTLMERLQGVPNLSQSGRFELAEQNLRAFLRFAEHDANLQLKSSGTTMYFANEVGSPQVLIYTSAPVLDIVDIYDVLQDHLDTSNEWATWDTDKYIWKDDRRTESIFKQMKQEGWEAPIPVYCIDPALGTFTRIEVHPTHLDDYIAASQEA